MFIIIIIIIIILYGCAGVLFCKGKRSIYIETYTGWPQRFYKNTVHFTVHLHQKYRTIPYIFRKKIPYIPYILLYRYRTYRKFSFTGTVHAKKTNKKKYLYSTHTQILISLKKNVPNVFKRQLRIFIFFV